MLSAPIVITGPEGDVVELEPVKTFLRVDGDDLDEEIGAYIDATIADIERMTSTRLGEQVVELRADSFEDLEHLTIGPVNAVVAITYRDAAGDEVTIDQAEYELFGAGLEKGVRPKPGRRWPRGNALRASGAIGVRLNVGYGDAIPPSISLALKMDVRGRFDGVPFDLFTATTNDRIWL